MSAKSKHEGAQSALDRVQFKSDAQKQYYYTIEDNTISFATGYPGTGKTFVALLAGLRGLIKGQYEKVYVVTPFVEVGDEDGLGFLPGDLEEKMAPFIAKIECVVSELLDSHERMKQMFFNKQIEVLPLGHLRGRTLKDCFVVFDEAQNGTYLQIKTFMTRIGENCKYVVNGDIEQTDIDRSGMLTFMNIMAGMRHVGRVNFEIRDIVRSGILKDIVLRIYHHENRKRAAA